MKQIVNRGYAALPLILLIAACSSDPGSMVGVTPDDAQIDMDVAQYVADVTGDDVQLMTGEGDHVMKAGFGPAAGCEQGPGKHFHCGRRGFGLGDISYTRDVTFYDIGGLPQDGYNDQDTESINFVVSFSGTRSNDRMSMTVSRDRDFTVSGLYLTETTRIWNGTGESKRNRTRHSDENGDRTYDMSCTTTVTGVIIPVPRSSDWPQDGTIERTVTIEYVDELGDTQTKTRDVLITFNGDRFVPITINGETFTLDLATREIVEGG
jgi:hypothetical protein